MVVRSPICRKGSLWGSVPRAGEPSVHSAYPRLLCSEHLPGHCSVTRNTAATPTDKELPQEAHSPEEGGQD